MNVKKCLECGKSLRADNTIGYCRDHRTLSPIYQKIVKEKFKLPQNVQKRKDAWKNLSEEKRAKIRENNKYSCQRYRSVHPERKSQSALLWMKKNPEKTSLYQQTSHYKNRTTIQGKINKRISTAINISIRTPELIEGRGWEKIVGYTAFELKSHLISLFKEGMTWEKFIDGEIELDHITPRSSFKYESIDDLEFKQCWALSNLQPLWKRDNKRKSTKTPP